MLCVVLPDLISVTRDVRDRCMCLPKPLLKELLKWECRVHWLSGLQLKLY